jgi:hypothetical protein
METVIAQGTGQLTLHKRNALKHIELLLQWRGRLNTGDLIESLGITRQSASKLITSYKELYPNAVSYNAQVKSYEPTPKFSPRLTDGNFQEYLSIFQRESTGTLPIYMLASGQCSPSPYILRPILNAIENHQRLDVFYASISSPEFEERIISPHSLIYDGSRWHVRAWCEKNQGYRDFVLTRIREVFGIEGSSQYGLELDKVWNTWIDLSIEPDPRLSEARRNIVAMDYGMSIDASEKLRRTYRVREALVIYWLQQLRLDRYNDRAEVQQIVLSDTSLADAERWIR